MNATLLFLQELALYPQQMGAVIPSSRHLARVMARCLPDDPAAYVLELGPGTGAVTKALLQRGLAEDRLIAIEKSARLAALLRRRFPKATIITGDACHLDRLLRRQTPEVTTVGAVISSLPLRVFSADAARTLGAKIRSILHPSGKWVQFSYYLGRGRPEATTRFELENSDVVWLNVPPARVNVYRRRSAPPP